MEEESDKSTLNLVFSFYSALFFLCIIYKFFGNFYMIIAFFNWGYYGPLSLPSKGLIWTQTRARGFGRSRKKKWIFTVHRVCAVNVEVGRVEQKIWDNEVVPSRISIYPPYMFQLFAPFETTSSTRTLMLGPSVGNRWDEKQCHVVSRARA